MILNLFGQFFHETEPPRVLIDNYLIRGKRDIFMEKKENCFFYLSWYNNGTDNDKIYNLELRFIYVLMNLVLEYVGQPLSSPFSW